MSAREANEGAKRAKLARISKPGRVQAWVAWVHPQDAAPIRGRLIAVRLPDDKAAEARQRLRREQGGAVTAESLAMAHFVVVYTTVPESRIGDERILELYSLRWQVELHIKRDKSIAGLDQLPNFRDDTIHSWICAKMLLTQIARAIPTTDIAIPPCVDSDARDDGAVEAISPGSAPPPRRPGGRGTLARPDAHVARHLLRASAHSAA